MTSDDEDGDMTKRNETTLKSEIKDFKDEFTRKTRQECDAISEKIKKNVFIVKVN